MEIHSNLLLNPVFVECEKGPYMQQVVHVCRENLSQDRELVNEEEISARDRWFRTEVKTAGGLKVFERERCDNICV